MRVELELAEALEREFGLVESAIASDDPWREDPLPFPQFAKEHLNIELWPVQQELFEQFLGSTVEDTKRLFTQDPPTPYNCAVLALGKGCLGPWERIKDYRTGFTRTVEEWANLGESLTVLSWDGDRPVLASASPVYLKGRAQLYRVTLDDGRSFVATAEHRCLTPDGWMAIGQMHGQCNDQNDGHTETIDSTRIMAIAAHDYGANFGQCNDQNDGHTETIDSTRIMAIAPIGEGEFYDLTVEDTGCYFDAQGILHHNSGKDISSAMALAWFVHILLCLHSPQKFLGLEETEAIDIAIASPTLRQTRRITFAKFKNRLKNWSWLRSLLPTYGIKNPARYLKAATEAADHVELPHNIHVHNLPLNATSAEGFNMLAFILSEFAGMDTEAAAASATDVFQSFVSSGRTRYQKAWKGFLASFPRSLNDPQEKLIQAHGQGLFPELYVVRRATWEVHPGRSFEDFATDFARNPEDSWAKYGAKPRAAIDAYFRSPELLLLHASGAPIELLREKLDLPEDHLQAIAQAGIDPIIEVNQFGDPVLDRRGFPQLARWFRGQVDAAGDPYEYYVHLDPGLSGDAYAFAMGHIHKLDGGGLQPTIDLSFRWTGSMFHEFGEITRPAWFPDTVEQKEAISAAEVDFRTVREFIFFLKVARGFNIAIVTIDGWNSVENIQELRKRDIPVGDRVVNKEDYDEFKSMVYNRQLRFYARRVLIEEAYKLQILNASKVEAPRTKEGDSAKNDSHKDVTDAVAAVCRRMVLMLDAGMDFAELPEVEPKKTSLVDLDSSGLSTEQSSLLRMMGD